MGYLIPNYDDADIVAAVGEGWEPVSHAISPHESLGFFLSILMKREADLPTIPDDIEELSVEF